MQLAHYKLALHVACMQVAERALPALEPAYPFALIDCPVAKYFASLSVWEVL